MFVWGYLIFSAVAAGLALALHLAGFVSILPMTLSVIIGLAVSLFLGGIVIRLFTRPLADQLDTPPAGLENGGLYIGYLERALIMLLVMMGEPTGIGFLIAAKSILRFGEVKDTGQRKMSEYIIIGTFFSFGWGLLIAMATTFLARLAQMML